MLTQHLEIHLAEANSEGVIHKFIDEMPLINMRCREKETMSGYLVQWQQKYMQLLESILDPRLQVKPHKSKSKGSLIW